MIKSLKFDDPSIIKVNKDTTVCRILLLTPFEILELLFEMTFIIRLWRTQREVFNIHVYQCKNWCSRKLVIFLKYIHTV